MSVGGPAIAEIDRAPSSDSAAQSFPAGTEPGFGIYVHWPFCAQKCPYCDFNSHVRMAGVDEVRFAAAFRRELATMAARVPGRRVSSIFLGGGTPSLMQPATVAAILDEIARLWPVEPDAEITLEANPNSVEASRFRGYRTAGVNRVSIGVQSLIPADLSALGRLHSVDEAVAAIGIAARTFERYSFDLIYARPRQTPTAWRQELLQALELAGSHLSLYQLTIEPGTPYARLQENGRLVVPDGEAARQLYEMTQELCEARGLPAYEVSNHAAPGQESRHNLLYWRYGEYVGVGPGAHGRVVVGGQRLATLSELNPERWLDQVEAEGHGCVEELEVTRAEQADEMLLMGLRISEGLDLRRFERLSGLTPTPAAIRDLVAMGLLFDRTDAGSRRLVATPAGRLVLDQVILRLADNLAPPQSRAEFDPS
jgi:oxygen-independent coproporphyrinogen-3 oxidase